MVSKQKVWGEIISYGPKQDQVIYNVNHSIIESSRLVTTSNIPAGDYLLDIILYVRDMAMSGE